MQLLLWVYDQRSNRFCKRQNRTLEINKICDRRGTTRHTKHPPRSTKGRIITICFERKRVFEKKNPE